MAYQLSCSLQWITAAVRPCTSVLVTHLYKNVTKLLLLFQILHFHSMPQPKGGKSGKEKKDPKKQLSELSNQNEQLTQELASVRADLTVLREQFSIVVTKMTSCVNNR